MTNIVLIGFMGTGKTTVGKALADKLGRPFVDIDREIETNCGMTVDEIFKVYGESFFREQERCAINNVSRHGNAVVATGGGAVLSPENVTHLKNSGIVVSLQAPAEVILRRVEKDAVKRPLLNKPDRLQAINKLLEERAGSYRIADFGVETSEHTPWRVTDIIIDYLRSNGHLKEA
jgi:shikimate kinase